jgi:IS1 family transposase
MQAPAARFSLQKRIQVASGGSDLCAGEKSYQRRKLMRLTHEMCLGTSAALKVVLQGLAFSGQLNTAFIERVNLTIRHRVAWLVRRTWATVKPAPQLLVHLWCWQVLNDN